MKKKISFICLAVLALLLAVSCNPNPSSEYLKPGEYNVNWGFVLTEYKEYTASFSIYKPATGESEATLKLTATGNDVTSSDVSTAATSQDLSFKFEAKNEWLCIGSSLQTANWDADGKVDFQVDVKSIGYSDDEIIEIKITGDNFNIIEHFYAKSFTDLTLTFIQETGSTFADLKYINGNFSKHVTLGPGNYGRTLNVSNPYTGEFVITKPESGETSGRFDIIYNYIENDSTPISETITITAGQNNVTFSYGEKSGTSNYDSNNTVDFFLSFVAAKIDDSSAKYVTEILTDPSSAEPPLLEYETTISGESSNVVNVSLNGDSPFLNVELAGELGA